MSKKLKKVYESNEETNKMNVTDKCTKCTELETTTQEGKINNERK